METNVINATEKITKAASGKNLKAAGGIGAVLLVGFGLAYELLVKPSRAKKKDREAVEVIDTEEDDDVDVEITAF